MTDNAKAQDSRQHIVIVGGGTTGWITAVALAHQLKIEYYRITLIESSDIGAIGVGEAVIPSFVTFIRNLGIDEQAFIQATQATFKLGIEFRDWRTRGEHYFHHFGALGRRLDGHNFLHCWLKSQDLGDVSELMDFAPAAVMAKHERFFLPTHLPDQSPFAEAAYAYQFDSKLVGLHLRRLAETKGVVRIDAKVERVRTQTDKVQEITGLELDTGDLIEGDLYIDCSGFRSLLMRQALEVGYQDWRHYLPCDRAVAVQTSTSGRIPPYTVSHARDSGWTWQIPLQHRVGNGYVFSSEHCNDDQAVRCLLDVVDGTPLNEPRLIPFRTGMNDSFWQGNCVAMGLAGGFLEPLESTAIHLVTRGVQFLLELFPDRNDGPGTWHQIAAEYSQRMHADYIEIRDFLLLHYCTTERNDTEFWRHCQGLPLPESLQQQLQRYQALGEVALRPDALFKEASWQAVMNGMGVRPQRYHPFTAMSDFDAIRASMQSARSHLQQEVVNLPQHQDFLAQQCPAPEPD